MSDPDYRVRNWVIEELSRVGITEPGGLETQAAVNNAVVHLIRLTQRLGAEIDVLRAEVEDLRRSGLGSRPNGS